MMRHSNRDESIPWERAAAGWLLRAGLVLSIVVGAILQAAVAKSVPRMGLVLMHGKGGAPARHVGQLASSLKDKGYLVANLEMPWSERRSYDTSVVEAESEVESALGELRNMGAAILFVAGHSQGGLFALYFGGRHSVDGIIAIAPGGNVGSPIFRGKVGESVALARKLVADGKGNDRARFLDFEASKGTYTIVCTPAVYLSWFDPEGPMNELIAVKTMNPNVPVLFIVPKGDYPGLLKAKQSMFDSLPWHPLTTLYEPDSTHLDAPAASLDEIERWTTEVASQSIHAALRSPMEQRDRESAVPSTGLIGAVAMENARPCLIAPRRVP